MNRISRRIASYAGTRHLDTLAAADRASDAVDRAMVRAWLGLLRILRDPHMTFAQRRDAARNALLAIFQAGHASLLDSLSGLVHRGHSDAADTLAGTLPLEVLRGIGQRKQVAETGQIMQLPLSHSLIEGSRKQPGIVRFARDSRTGRLIRTDRAAELREPVRRRLSDAEQRRRFRDLLFPSPSEQQVVDILRHPIAGKSWEQDLSLASKIAGFDPERMANTIAMQFSLGRPPQEIARELEPIVSGVKSSARRIARTYGMQVAHAAQMQAHNQLGDMVIGWQIHEVLDQHTRPAHRARNGQIYYKRPGPGQKGLDEMPNPPLESEREGRVMAWNCRGWLSPVLVPEQAMIRAPEFTNNQDEVIPDPAVYSQWFQQADLSARKLAVGARRYAAMEEKLGRPPTWEDFVHPSGELLTLADIRNETRTDRLARVQAVRADIARKRRDIAQVARLGFVMPSG